jgi:hypothetical protein
MTLHEMLTELSPTLMNADSYGYGDTHSIEKHGSVYTEMYKFSAAPDQQIVSYIGNSVRINRYLMSTSLTSDELVTGYNSSNDISQCIYCLGIV